MASLFEGRGIFLSTTGGTIATEKSTQIKTCTIHNALNCGYPGMK